MICVDGLFRHVGGLFSESAFRQNFDVFRVFALEGQLRLASGLRLELWALLPFTRPGACIHVLLLYAVDFDTLLVLLRRSTGQCSLLTSLELTRYFSPIQRHLICVDER